MWIYRRRFCVLLGFWSQNAEKDWDLKTGSQGEDWDLIPRKENIKARAHKNFFLQLSTHNATRVQSSLIRNLKFDPKFIMCTVLLPGGQWKQNSSTVENSDSIALAKERFWKTGCTSRLDHKHAQAKGMVSCTATHTPLSYHLFPNNFHTYKPNGKGQQKEKEINHPLEDKHFLFFLPESF